MKKAMLNGYLAIILGLCSFSAFAIDCPRATTLVENSICNNDELMWLDETLNLIYQTVLVKDPQRIYHMQQEWQLARDNCNNDACIKNAYLQGISNISGVSPETPWRGVWWNSSAVNGSGGKLQISRLSEWDFLMNAEAWAGANRANFSGSVNKVYGMGIIDNIRDTSNCKLLLIPVAPNELQVYSNASKGCRIDMPTGVYLDGKYVKADKDPRPKATLISIGLLRSEDIDKKFRLLVGDDYNNFVDTANAYIYGLDEDNLGANVLSLWVQGKAHEKAAIIMYTLEGKIWAARVEINSDNKPVMHYYTTEKENQEVLPKTISAWQLNFIDR